MRGYIGKILDGGYNVAIAEQMETLSWPRDWSRDVTQIITPGRCSMTTCWTQRRAFSCCAFPSRNLCGLALLTSAPAIFPPHRTGVTVAALETESTAIGQRMPAPNQLP